MAWRCSTLYKAGFRWGYNRRAHPQAKSPCPKRKLHLKTAARPAQHGIPPSHAALIFLPCTLVHPCQVWYNAPDDKLSGGGCCARMAAGCAKAASAAVYGSPSHKPRLLLMERIHPYPRSFRPEVLSVKRRRLHACPFADTSAGFHSEHRRRCRIGRPAGYRYCAVGADYHIPGGMRHVRVPGRFAERPGHRSSAANENH